VARVGLILPSSNRVVEDALAARRMAASWHVTRLRVERVALDSDAARQFEAARLVEAAGLLADAAVDVIVWAGSAGAWTGIAAERALASRLRDVLARPVTTTTLAVVERLHHLGAPRIGLLTPFTAEVHAAIRRELAGQGLEVVCERALGLESSLAMAELSALEVQAEALAVGLGRAQAIVILCTNLRGWEVAADLERATGLPVVDSVAETLDAALGLAGGCP
jgi:maleate isomerase